MTPTETAYAFVDAINSGDPDKIALLMTPFHTFIDSDGSRHTGLEEMRSGWEYYFSRTPDFRIRIEDAMAHKNTVALFGEAEGTFAEDGEIKSKNHWSVPAAWRVVVENERVAVWQLYYNPEAMRKILKRIKAKEKK